jgi:hypothetical protein
MKPGNLDSELEKLAPKLSKLKMENPFQVPGNYFDSLPDHIQQKVNNLPYLGAISKETPFQVPEEYFNSLPYSIQQRLSEENKNIFEEWISVFLRPKYSLSFAFLVVLIIVGIKFLYKPDIEERYSEHTIASYNEIRNSGYIADLDETTLIEMLADAESNSAPEDKSMEQYLIDNDIDITQLESHL